VKAGPKITGVDLVEFEREVRDYVKLKWEPGAVAKGRAWAVRILTDVGVTGECTTSSLELAAQRMWIPYLIGQNALERERIYHDVKRILRQSARLGLAPLDIALWDLAGKYFDAPVYRLLRGYRTKLPAYASTALGDEHEGGLNSPEAYADFAEQCLELGYRAYKAHPWWDAADIDREVALVHAIARRVGGKMDLMLDPACGYETFGDAVKVGKACDEGSFYWYEDPFQDGGIAHEAHRKLRQLIKTPILQGEHVRGVEDRINFVTAEATDFVRGDVNYEGITATIKLANAAEALGLDIEMHGGGPATRHCMAAIRNSNYYELGLVHPKIKAEDNPVYLDGYAEGRLDLIDEHGCVTVPEGPGLGVSLNWDYITAHRTALIEYR